MINCLSPFTRAARMMNFPSEGGQIKDSLGWGRMESEGGKENGRYADGGVKEDGNL